LFWSVACSASPACTVRRTEKHLDSCTAPRHRWFACLLRFLSPSSQDRLLRLRHLAISARCRWLRRRRGLFLLRQNQLHGQLRDHIYFKRRHTFATADWFRSIPMAVSTCSSTSAQGNRLSTYACCHELTWIHVHVCMNCCHHGS
jgi:hypothetical protein